MTPTSINRANYFAALAYDTDEDDEDIDTDEDNDSNCNDNQQAHNTTLQQAHNTTLHTQNFCPSVRPRTTQGKLLHIIDSTSALSDSGATSHFICEGAHVTNKRPATEPITITLPDGATLQSTHTCNVDIPWLKHEATTAHVVPGLAHASLLSTAKFCDAGYTVVFDTANCNIYDRPTLVLMGERDTTTNLWRLPLNPQAPPTPPKGDHRDTHKAPHRCTTPQHLHNVHTIPHLQNRVKFMHQVLFCPPIQTLLRAVNLGFLHGFPFLTSDIIIKHLAKSPATAKGRLRLRPAGHNSTRPRTPTQNANIFCFAALADKRH